MKVVSINKIHSNINFKTNITSSNMDSRDAKLMIQSPIAALNFSRERYIAEQAGSVSASPIKALGYKLYRTFSYITEHEKTNNKKLYTIA